LISLDSSRLEVFDRLTPTIIEAKMKFVFITLGRFFKFLSMYLCLRSLYEDKTKARCDRALN
jgi:hypothetical protein